MQYLTLKRVYKYYYYYFFFFFFSFFFFFKQKTAYEITVWLEFRRVLFRSVDWECVTSIDQDHIYNLLTVLIYLQNVVVDHAWRSHKQLVSPKLQECLFIHSQFSSGENSSTYSKLVQLVVITYSLSTCTT